MVYVIFSINRVQVLLAVETHRVIYFLFFFRVEEISLKKFSGVLPELLIILELIDILNTALRGQDAKMCSGHRIHGLELTGG